MADTKSESKDPSAVKDTRPSYQSPAIVVLGELARGFGGCISGSAASGTCTSGFNLTGCTGGGQFQ